MDKPGEKPTLSQLPPGYQSSPLTASLEQGVVDSINASFRWMNGGNMTSLAEMRIDWDEENFCRETDTRVVLAPDGTVAGYIDLWDITALHVRWFSQGYVHPAHMGRGIGTYLLHWSIKQGRQKIAKAPEGARVVLHQMSNSVNALSYQLFTQNGYKIARSSYRMRIDLNQLPAAPVVPDGIVIRPIQPGQEERLAIWAAFDAFRDHWGFVDEPFEEYLKRWMHYIENDPNYDPSLYFMAMDSTEVAGVSLCYPKIEEDPDMAWVGTLGVRRAWRRHGLGLALLQHSFAEFSRRGIRRAGLGVDTQNLTGATRLYEKAGMRVWRKNNTYEYELRPGQELMRQAIDEQSGIETPVKIEE